MPAKTTQDSPHQLTDGSSRMRAWTDAGCSDVTSAQLLEDAGFCPEDVAVLTDAEIGLGGYEATLGYKFAVCDISLVDVSNVVYS